MRVFVQSFVNNKGEMKIYLGTTLPSSEGDAKVSTRSRSCFSRRVLHQKIAGGSPKIHQGGPPRATSPVMGVITVPGRQDQHVCIYRPGAVGFEGARDEEKQIWECEEHRGGVYLKEMHGPRGTEISEVTNIPIATSQHFKSQLQQFLPHPQISSRQAKCRKGFSKQRGPFSG